MVAPDRSRFHACILSSPRWVIALGIGLRHRKSYT